MYPQQRQYPSLVASSILSALFLITLLPIASSLVVPGARDTTLSASWQWSYLDPTPRHTVRLSNGTEIQYPHTIGVSDRDTRDIQGERFVPSIRYGHTSVTYEDTMIITHGYQYDMSTERRGAVWLSDTWRFNYTSHLWSRLHPHITHPDHGPTARYAAIGVVVGGDLYLHGGDDGGYAEKESSYKHAIYGDVWRMILKESPHHRLRLYTWHRVQSVVSAHPLGSTSHYPSVVSSSLPLDQLYRCQHGYAVVPVPSRHFIAQADQQELKEAGVNPPSTEITPYLFIAHGLYTSARAPSLNPPSLDDPSSFETYNIHDGDELFVFSFQTKVWRQLRTSEKRPQRRFGHAMVYVPELNRPLKNGDEHLSGSLFLYGGFSRLDGNRGDLWSLSLRTFEWTELHATYSSSASPYIPSPGPRAYASMYWTPDGKLHLFGGARCEPGCVTSAEMWVYDLAGGNEESNAASSSSQWTLFSSSPYSPSSRSYPTRTASGSSQGYHTYTHAEESIQKGYPTHRYKQTMVLSVPITESSRSPDLSVTYSSYLFGGESYSPSAYYHDCWRFDYSPSTRISSSLYASYLNLIHLLHLQPFASFERQLARERQLPPTTSFHVHAPPAGWPTAPVKKRHRVWSWPGVDENGVEVGENEEEVDLKFRLMCVFLLVLLAAGIAGWYHAQRQIVARSNKKSY